MKTAFLILCAVGFVGLSLPASVAYAQIETLETATVASSGGDLAANDLVMATSSYYTAVEEYRTTEKRFLLAREDYFQQSTLASLEEANRRAKDVLRARSDVLQKYYQYLRLALESSTGIELSEKEATLAQLRFWETTLSDHREATAALATRPQLSEHFQLLNNQKTPLVSSAYSALVLMKLGAMQTAFDTTQLMREYLTERIQASSISASEKELKLRGLEEVDRLGQSARENYQKLLADYKLFSTQQTYNEQNYRTFQENADISYLQLRQSLSFLREVAQGLQ